MTVPSHCTMGERVKKSHFAKIGFYRAKIVALGLNLLPFRRRYENVIHSSVALTTKEIIEL